MVKVHSAYYAEYNIKSAFTQYLQSCLFGLGLPLNAESSFVLDSIIVL